MFRISLALAFVLACAGAESRAACSPGNLPSEGFAAAVERSAPAVVQVVVLRGARDPAEDAAGFEFFQPLQGLPLPGAEAMDRTFSSGFFISADGLLLASAHAVYDARGVWAVTADGRRLRAQVLGVDRKRDVALLKVDASAMPAVRLEEGTNPCPGAWVIAVGSPFGFDRTVTAGVVSMYPRYLHGSSIPLIQSDVVTNPGSSGGPLFDASGTLVGMNTMIFSSTGIYVGMSFALPADELLRTASALRRGGASHPGEAGLRLQPLTPDLARAFGLEDTDGALVVRVDEAGAASRAGLRTGDVVLGFARGERLHHAAIEARLASADAGSLLAMEIWRDGSWHSLRLQLAAAPADPLPQQAPPAQPESRLGLELTVLKARAGSPAGVYVESAAGSALLAGLERGDRIAAVNGIAVASIDEFDAALTRTRGRDVVALLVARGSSAAFVPVTRGR